MATFFWMEVGDTKKPFDQSLPRDEQPPALEEEVPTLMEENTVITEDPHLQGLLLVWGTAN